MRDKYGAGASAAQSAKLVHVDCAPELTHLKELFEYVSRWRRGGRVESAVPRLADYEKMYEHDADVVYSTVYTSLFQGYEPFVRAFRELGVSDPKPSHAKVVNAVGRAKCADLVRVAHSCAADKSSADMLVRFIRYVRTAAFVQACTKMKLPMDHLDKSGYPRVTIAAVEGDFLSLYLLLANGANARTPCARGWTPLQHVISVCNGSCKTFGLGCEHEIVYELLYAANNQT